MTKRLLIVGAGQAGAWAARTLRETGFDGAIDLIGDEAHLPYERPELSKKVLIGALAPSALCMLDRDFYRANRIDVHTRTAAVGLDANAKVVMFQNGACMPYDQLILATGARVRELAEAPRGRAGVHYLRHMADALALRQAMTQHARLVVIGAGFLGLEVAAAASSLGLQTTVVERAPRVLDRVAPPSVAEDVEAMHRARGVAFRFSSTLESVQGVDSIEGVWLADGEWLECDLLVVAVGVIPNVELARLAGAVVADGIEVDEYGASSILGVYAIGDVANHPNSILGGRLRLESWQNAQNQAICVARGIASGTPQPYREVPWFWSDQSDLNIQMVGFPSRADCSITRRMPAPGLMAVHFHLREGQLVGATTLNAAREIRALRQLVAYGARPCVKQLSDPAVPLRQMLPMSR